MIVVACGTHHQPFDRLVCAADVLADHFAETVVVQRGSSRAPAPRCHVVDEVPPTTFVAWLRTARIVVLHAGSSSFLEARSEGRTPILVPRRPEHGEHVDDHQVRFAASVGREAVVAEPTDLVDVVARFVEPVRPRNDRGVGFAERFGALMAAWHPDTALPRR